MNCESYKILTKPSWYREIKTIQPMCYDYNSKIINKYDGYKRYFINN